MLSAMNERLISLAAQQGGVFTAAQARTAGYTRAAIRHRVKRGHWVVVRPRCYAHRALVESVADLPGPREAMRIWAGRVTLGSDCVGSHRSAARAQGFDVFEDTAPMHLIELTRPAEISGSYRHGDVAVMPAPCPPEHIEVRYDVPVTVPARTVVDVARHWSLTDALVVADSALRSRRVTTTDLQLVLDSQANWPGVLTAARTLPHADARAENPLESVCRAVFILNDLPMPDLQVNIGDADGFIGRVDFLWREYGVIGEADGLLKYTSPEVLRLEKLRQERLEQAGFIVIRFTWHEVVHQPAVVARRVRAALARGARLRAA